MLDRTRLSRIQDKATGVASKLSSRTVDGRLPFGAEHHKYRMNPPIAPGELETFEVLHGIRLPEDYRCFLLEVGDGGAGPAYGVLPLRYWAWHVSEWNHLTGSPRPLVERPSASYLASPCQLRADVDYDGTWQERLAPQDYDSFQGMMAVCYQGCADCVLLVVSGAERGRLVSVGESWNPPVFLPMPDFLSWYETWQDSVLSDERLVWTGYPPKR
jgi:hypothetical protein